MNTGPVAGGASNRTELTFVEKANIAYGGSAGSWSAPEWVTEMAVYADTHGLKSTGKLIGYSGSTVSQVIANKYPGDTAAVAERVGGALMGVTVFCDGAGLDMARNTCLDWQKKPRAATSSQRTKMYRACHGGCPHFRVQGGGNE